jgi:hypothetical protein
LVIQSSHSAPNSSSVIFGFNISIPSAAASVLVRLDLLSSAGAQAGVPGCGRHRRDLNSIVAGVR